MALQRFICKAKQNLDHLASYEKIHIVLGNESCDLDSTVSSIALAFFLHLKLNANNLDSNTAVLPVMNVNANLFPLRTESCYLLTMNGIDINTLIYRDQIDYKKITREKTVETSLVDHHVLAEHDAILYNTVIEIFDHRPINNEEICRNAGLKQNIKMVGSCATLIGNEIMESQLLINTNEIYNLLYGAIIYDTIGLDLESGRASEEDILIGEKLEKILKPLQSRKDFFNILWKIHSDISSLTTKDLLYRDLKIVKNIPMSGLPMLADTYLKRSDASIAISSIADEYSTHTVILIGIDASAEVRRDIGIYSTEKTFLEILIGLLKKASTPTGSNLLLTECDVNMKNIRYFRQNNIKLTRKFILPLVAEAVVLFESKKGVKV